MDRSLWWGLGQRWLNRERARFSLLLARPCLEWPWGNWKMFCPSALSFTEGEPVLRRINWFSNGQCAIILVAFPSWLHSRVAVTILITVFKDKSGNSSKHGICKKHQESGLYLKQHLTATQSQAGPSPFLPCGRRQHLSAPWTAHRSSWSCRARTDEGCPTHGNGQGNPQCGPGLLSTPS